MSGLPRLAQGYIAFLACLALATALGSVPYLPRTTDGILALAGFTVAACAAQVYHIFLPRVPGAFFTIATALHIAIAIIFGPAAAIWSALFSSTVATLTTRRGFSRVIFNSSQLALSYGAAGVAYQLLWDGPPLSNPWPALPAVLALGVVYFFVNTGLVFLIVSIVDRMPFLRLWRSSAKRIILHDVVMIAVGLVFVVIWSYNRWTIPLVAPLVVVLYQSMSAVGKMEQQTKDALLALARVIDQRDCRTYAHSERVAEYVAWTCDELRLPADQTEIVVYAGRLHDLGKVGVPDGLLLKPGKLTDEEQAEFRRHPDVGAAIIAQFPIFREGADMVRFEHEWVNGHGYPRGLRGEEIPLGARIIAVADAYEAMTADRPYRSGVSPPEAVERLVAGTGTQFDPAVVGAFVSALQKKNLVPLGAPFPAVAQEVCLPPAAPSRA